MKAHNFSLPEKPASRWAVLAVVGFFLLVGTPGSVYANLPTWLAYGLIFSLIIVTFVAPLVVGFLSGLPRWSLLFVGIILGGVGVYLLWILLSLLSWPVFKLIGSLLNTQESLAGRLAYSVFYEGNMWLAIGLANGLFVGLVALTPRLHALRERFAADWSLLSFSLYGGTLVKYLIDFDEYRYDEPYVFIGMAALALGAWGYLRIQSPGRRTLALLAGLTVCMLAMGIGKYYLVPLQDWPFWLEINPPATERLYESLRTIPIWLWGMALIGLPGMLQHLRKTPRGPEYLTPG